MVRALQSPDLMNAMKYVLCMILPIAAVACSSAAEPEQTPEPPPVSSEVAPEAMKRVGSEGYMCTECANEHLACCREKIEGIYTNGWYCCVWSGPTE